MSARPPGSEVDGAGVTSGGVDVAPKLSIESGDVAIRQTYSLDHRVPADKGHVHAAQDGPTGGLRQVNLRWIEMPEGVDRQTLNPRGAPFY